MSRPIEKGQEFVAARPVDSGPEPRPIRIRVMGKPVSTYGLMGYGKVPVATVTEDGREVRHRPLSADQLHDTALTRDGSPRRTGYVLDPLPE